MRVNVAKVGMELVDKLTGVAYKVTAIEEPTKGTVTKAVAAEILDEDDEREPQEITITADNDRTYRITKWVPDEELHNANIVNGILQVDGKDVVMGSIVAKTILKVFPGTIVFSSEGEEAEGRDIIREYMPSRDRMTVLGSMEPTSVVIDDSDTRVIYGFNITKDIEVEDGDKKVKKTVFDRAGLYVLTKGMLDYQDLADVELGDDYDDDYDEEEYENNDSIYGVDGFLGFDLKNVIKAQGDKYIYVPQIDNEKGVMYKVYRVTNRLSFNGLADMPGKLVAVTGNRTSAKNLGKAIFSGEGFKKVDNVIIRSNELNDYIYLVDAIRDAASDTNTYVFATEGRKMKTVIRKMTADRGEIVTIED